jgi:DNA-binding NtrC family response regulator
MGDSSTASLLIIEDEPEQLRLYTQALAGYRLTCVSTASAALALIAKQMPDLILLDHVLAQGELGLDALPRIKAAAAHVPVIIISGTLAVTDQLKALQGPESAHYVLEKPVGLKPLRETVKRALDDCGFGEMVRSLQSLERSELINTGERERIFTERLARQHDLLKRLRGTTEKPNLTLLAADYRVDRRTIRRDLQDLVQRGQLPSLVIEGEPE